jgi:hypothetical protein
MLNNEAFALIPYNPKPDKDMQFLFNFFRNLDINLLMRKLMVFKNHNNLKQALSIILHYKGKIPYFNKDLNHKKYLTIKPFLDDSSISKFNILYQPIVIENILNDKITVVDDIDMNVLKTSNISNFINVSIKLDINNINEVFNEDKFKVFDWINKHPDKYAQLKQLNQPQFIFDNMNGKLNINDGTLRYFFEICPIDLEVYKELKKTISLETIWKFTNHKLSLDFIVELVDTLEEVVFIINIPKIPLSTIEAFMKRLKIKFPLLYTNFNSLLLMKKDFGQ